MLITNKNEKFQKNVTLSRRKTTFPKFQNLVFYFRSSFCGIKTLFKIELPKV